MAADPTNIPSGFRPYPQQGFQIQAPNNYWQGGNFYIPGINQNAPVMTSNIMSQFPGLAGIMSASSPPPSMGAIPFVGGLQAMTPTNPLDRAKQKRLRPGKGFMGLGGLLDQ